MARRQHGYVREGREGWLRHGYNGVNAMLSPRHAGGTQRFDLTRSAERDGSGIAIERHYDARPGDVLLRVCTDDGLVIHALRDDLLAEDGRSAPPRIGRIE